VRPFARVCVLRYTQIWTCCKKESKTNAQELVRYYHPPDCVHRSKLCPCPLGNITRFYILGASLQIPLPLSVPEVCPKRALCRVSLTPSKTKMATATATHSRASQPCTITEVIVALALSAIRIDRRPSLTGEAFQDVYFVEMQEAHASAAPAVEQELTWELKLEGAIERVKSLGVHVVLLGSWGMWGPRCASHRL
jgi:prephenate dehydratase